MEVGKITIKPITSFITPFQSDTLFGSFAWAYRYIFGEDALKKLLKDFTTNPFIVFSDGFIKGFLPKPYLKPIEISVEDMGLNKEYKKTKYIPKDVILNNIKNLTDKVIFEHFKKYKSSNQQNPFKVKRDIVLKNSIDRLENKVKEGFYSTQETFIDEEIEIYFKYHTITIEQIEEVFYLMSKRGYGKKKSAGKGKFKITKLETEFAEKDYFKKNPNSKFFLSLSTSFYDRENLELYYGKSFTKFPKAGGDYAYSRPFKNPIIVYEPGSTFIIKRHKEFYGKAKENVFNLPGHYHSGFAIGIYFGE